MSLLTQVIVAEKYGLRLDVDQLADLLQRGDVRSAVRPLRRQATKSHADAQRWS